MRAKKEFGDFQTPLSLARRVAAMIDLRVGTVIEPTCGVGAFLQAAAERFGKSPRYWGFDVNADYVEAASAALGRVGAPKVTVQRRDFYTTDWEKFFSEQTGPLLIIGNPPWITNAGMGVIRGNNLPTKSNFQRHNGLDAKTGKANFDISEWMLVRLLQAVQGSRAAIAMLCKTATARKVLRHAWLNRFGVGRSSLHLIDAATEFGVSVDACLLYTHTGIAESESTATVYGSLSFDEPLKTFGLSAGELVSDLKTYHELSDLEGRQHRKWRSGVKHDAAQVLEFTRANGSFVNGLGERYELEDDYMFPLLKSSDLANDRLRPTRFVLLTQRRVGETTEKIRKTAPKTWQYLLDHADQLDNRGSSVYKNRARYSIFGVGNYSFSPAKVAISGLYKNLQFRAIGGAGGKPIMVDDTCYFIPCASKQEAEFFAELLNSETAQRFVSALVFTDAKRPVTVDVLKRVDLQRLAERAGRKTEAVEYLSSSTLECGQQRLLFAE
ncbi:MAG: N-6 DNA methylase [Acidobacteria bacterium]|nr:N-6 DNA methylase [Acidobacteriota bacterium]